MAKSVEERIEVLLDQLENPNLSESEIELIQKKIRVLESRKQ